MTSGERLCGWWTVPTLREVPLLLTGLPDPGRAVLHFGHVDPHADEGLIGKADGLVGLTRLGLVALFEEAHEIENELLGFGG